MDKIENKVMESPSEISLNVDNKYLITVPFNKAIEFSATRYKKDSAGFWKISPQVILSGIEIEDKEIRLILKRVNN